MATPTSLRCAWPAATAASARSSAPATSCMSPASWLLRASTKTGNSGSAPACASSRAPVEPVPGGLEVPEVLVQPSGELGVLGLHLEQSPPVCAAALFAELNDHDHLSTCALLLRPARLQCV